MFKRIYAVFLAVLLLLTVSLTAICWGMLRSHRISERLEALTADAREIAWIAGQSSGFLLTESTFISGFSSSYRQYLNHKAEGIHEEYGAYILIVDRFGNIMDNMRTAWADDPDFVESLNTREIANALAQVLNGQEISVRSQNGSAPTFTVGVPFIQNGYVTGAVFIRTNAQVIEDGTTTLIQPIALASLGAALLAAVLVWLLVRSIMRPLKQVTDAASEMAEGSFSARADVKKATPEIADLAHVFNTMAERLEETERSRREFVANVSHELRSPVTSIYGFMQGMEDGTIPPEDHPKCLSIVCDETRRLNRLISDLLALSRLERDDAVLSPAAFDICELLRRVLICRMQDIEDKQLDIQCLFEQDSMSVYADSDRIEQVAVNLLDNALKFTPSSGCITLRCRREGGRIWVTVADNGIGILPEDKPHLFERFFTADRAHTSGKGTGLGLSISLRIMQMHGETLRVDDTTEGASFSFSLKPAESAGKVKV